MSILKRLFTIEGILKNKEIKGKLPSGKKIFKETFDAAWPSTVESVFIALMSSVDIIMVGSLGAIAVSSIAICTNPRFIILAPTLALNTTVVVLIARRKGENNKKAANDYLLMTVILSTIISFIMCFIGYLFAEPFLKFAGAKADYLPEALRYFKMMLIGQFFASVGLTMTSAQRAVGKTKISLITNSSANILNIIFNFLLIHGYFGFPALGVFGAAVATTIGNIASFIIATINILMPNQFISLRINPISEFGKKIKDVFKISQNALVEQAFLRIGFFLFAKAVASLGTNEFAAHTVVLNLLTITFAFGDGLQIANTSLVGRSLGAGRDDLAIVYTRIAKYIGLFLGMLVMIAVLIFVDEIPKIFINDPAVIKFTKIPLYYLVAIIFFQISVVITMGSLRGAGDLRFTAFIVIICIGILRPILSNFLIHIMNLALNGAWLSLFIETLIRFIMAQLRYNKGEWRYIKL